MKKRMIIVCTLILGILLSAGGLTYVRLRGGVRVKPVEQHTVADQVIFFRQDDEAWGADLLGDSAYTMKSSGCLVTSIASAISTDGEYITPGELNALFSDHAVYDSEGNLQWNKLAELDGYHVSVYQNVDVADIEQCLSDGHYPIVRVRRYGVGGIHYVLIMGVADGEYLCMDPLEDELTKLSDYLGLVHAVRCVWKEEDAIADTVGTTEE